MPVSPCNVATCIAFHAGYDGPEYLMDDAASCVFITSAFHANIRTTGAADKCIFIKGGGAEVFGSIIAQSTGKVLLYNSGRIRDKVTFANYGDMFVDGGTVDALVTLGRLGGWFDSHSGFLTEVRAVSNTVNCFSVMKSQNSVKVYGDSVLKQDRWHTDGILVVSDYMGEWFWWV